MSLLGAILCFFGALYFLYIACFDHYTSDYLAERGIGHSTSLIKWRFLAAALLVFAGVKLL